MVGWRRAPPKALGTHSRTLPTVSGSIATSRKRVIILRCVDIDIPDQPDHIDEGGDIEHAGLVHEENPLRIGARRPRVRRWFSVRARPVCHRLGRHQHRR